MEPLYQQVRATLRAAIVSGELAPGARLPSTRALARRLGVSRNVVMRAFELLAADGLVGGRIGSGTYVLGATRAAARRIYAPLSPSHLLAAAHYPTVRAPFRDADGNALALFRA